MTKLTIHAYDYWATEDRDGFRTVEKYFETRADAEAWAEVHSKYVYRGCFNSDEAKNETEMPTFKFEEIEFETGPKNDVVIIRDLIDKAVKNYGLKAVKTTLSSILRFYEDK